MDTSLSPSSADTDTSSGTSTASSSTTSSSYSSDGQFSNPTGIIAQSGDYCPPPPPSPVDDSEGEHPDPELDRQLAIAIAHIYTPTRSSTSASKSSQCSTNESGQSDCSSQQRSRMNLCNHSLVARIYTDEARCYHCKKAHFFGWVYRCRGCGYRVCHNCRPKFIERSWDSIGGLIRVEVSEGVAGVDGGSWPGWGLIMQGWE